MTGLLLFSTRIGRPKEGDLTLHIKLKLFAVAVALEVVDGATFRRGS